MSRTVVACGITTLIVGAGLFSAPATAASADGGVEDVLTIPAETQLKPAGSDDSDQECDEGDATDCYTFEDTKKIADYSAAYVTRAVRELYRNLPPPSHIWYVKKGTKGAKNACGAMTAKSFSYCTLDKSIALGQEVLWYFYEEAGDAAPLLGVAHEMSHHAQRIAGVPRPKSYRELITLENQADCMAGGIIKQLMADGIFTKDDLQDVDDMVPLIASAPEGEGKSKGPRTHGTLKERLGAVMEGVNGGMKACNRYYPKTPIISDALPRAKRAGR